MRRCVIHIVSAYFPGPSYCPTVKISCSSSSQPLRHRLHQYFLPASSSIIPHKSTEDWRYFYHPDGLHHFVSRIYLSSFAICLGVVGRGECGYSWVSFFTNKEHLRSRGSIPVEEARIIYIIWGILYFIAFSRWTHHSMSPSSGDMTVTVS